MLRNKKLEQSKYNDIIISFIKNGYDVIDGIGLIEYLKKKCDLSKFELGTIAILCSDDVLSQLENLNYIIKNDKYELIQYAKSKLDEIEENYGINLQKITSDDNDITNLNKEEILSKNECDIPKSKICNVLVGKGKEYYINIINENGVVFLERTVFPIIQLSIRIKLDNEIIERDLYVQFSDTDTGINIKKASLINYDISLKEAIEILNIIKNDIDSLYIFKEYIDGAYNYEKRFLKQKIKKLKSIKSILSKDISKYNQFLEKIYDITNNKNMFFNFKKYENEIFKIITNPMNNNISGIDIQTYIGILLATFNINFYLDNYEYLSNLIAEMIEANLDLEKEKVKQII